MTDLPDYPPGSTMAVLEAAQQALCEWDRMIDLSSDKVLGDVVCLGPCVAAMENLRKQVER